MATVVLTVHDPATRACAERRKAEGKTPREIRRCLKRYLARRLYRTSTRPDRGLTAIEDSDFRRVVRWPRGLCCACAVV